MSSSTPEAQAGERAEADRSVRLVDADIHPFLLPPLLVKRLSGRWRRHVEQFGLRSPFILELYPRASNGGMRVDSWPEAPGSFPGSDLGLVQRQLLDEYDVDYGILNSLGLLSSHDAPGLVADIARTLNDWLWEEWIDPEPRLLGSIVVPFEYPDLAVHEIERCAVDERWIQVLLPDSADEPLGSRKYWPIYEAAAGLGLPVAVHTAGYAPHHGTGWPSYYLEEHVAYSFVMQSQLVNMICDGLFEAVPDLKIVLTEAGATWLAGVSWALDAGWALLRDELPSLDRPPSEVIREHVWFTSQPIEEADDPQQFVQALEHAGLTDRLLFATDYPHWDFDSPSMAIPAAVPDDVRARILAGTACELYRLPLERRGD